MMEYLKALGAVITGIAIGLGSVILLMIFYLTALEFIWRHSDLAKAVETVTR